jgi:helix-turn-helix protein
MTSSDVIGVREAARIVGVHENTIRNWAKAGLLDSAAMPTNGERRFRRFSRIQVERLAQLELPKPPPADHVEAYRHGYEAGWRDAVKAAREAISRVPLSREREGDKHGEDHP